MHQLVQKIVRLHAGEETVALREQELLAYVKARAEFLWEGWVRQETRWELVPLVALAWHWLHRGANQGVYLANQAFGSLRNLGHFAETEPLIRRALALEEARFGLNHPNVATCLNNLAALLHETARLKEAEPIYRRALAIYERSFGPNDPRVATCLNNLAQLLQATNRADKAEPLYQRVLAIDEQSFGPSHPRVATHLNNLAQLLQSTDRPDFLRANQGRTRSRSTLRSAILVGSSFSRFNGTFMITMRFRPLSKSTVRSIAARRLCKKL